MEEEGRGGLIMDELVDKIGSCLWCFSCFENVCSDDRWMRFFFLPGKVFVLITINILYGNEEMHI